MTDAYALIVAQMQRYFDGLYYGDTSLLGEVFHTQARYVTASETPLTDLDMDSYFQRVRNRKAPANSSETRQDRIVSITFAGEDTALVVANCAIGPRYFTDLLSFVLVDGDWKIISKVFHFDTQ